MDTTTEKYNGYTNYETWNVRLWLNNDQSTDEEARGVVDTYLDDYEAAKALRLYVEDLTDLDEASLRSDLLSHALSRVNWVELVAHYRED